MPTIVAKGSFTLVDSMDGAALLLTNDSIAIPTDSAGNNGNYTGASSTFIVLLGAVDDSANWTVAAAPSAGVAGTLAGRTYTVTSITADAAYVDLTASRQGFASVTRRLSVVRIKAGAPGTAGANGSNGSNGANGQRSAILSMYRWSAAAPTTFPSGSSTYTWATGVFTAPATLNGWSIIPPAAVAGQTLWGIDALVTDTATTATTAASWSSTTPYPAGAAGVNGVNGGRGAGMYKVATSSGTWAAGDSATDAAAAGACPGGAVAGDTVTVYKSTDVSVAITKQWSGSAWVTPALVMHGSMVVDGTISTRQLAAGAVSADKLNVASLINSAGVYTSFKVQPASNQPLWLGNTDSAGNNPVPIFYIDRAGLGFFKGGLGANTVDADAIVQTAKTQINPYFLGAQAGSKQENTTSASMASLASVTLAAVTVIGGVVNLSTTLSGNGAENAVSTPTAVDPQWQVEIFRTSTAGTRVFNQTFTGSNTRYQEKEPGQPDFGKWYCTESISINVAFTDSGAPTSTVYVMRVTKVAGALISTLTRSYFGATRPAM